MRLQDIDLDIKKLDINDDNRDNRSFIVVYCDGKAKLTYLPDHGKTKVIKHQGKVKRVKFDEGEDF